MAAESTVFQSVHSFRNMTVMYANWSKNQHLS